MVVVSTASKDQGDTDGHQQRAGQGPQGRPRRARRLSQPRVSSGAMATIVWTTTGLPSWTARMMSTK